MSVDIRTCNLCIKRDDGGLMSYCNGCRRFVCTRDPCKRRHAKECAVPLAMSTAVASERGLNGFDVEYYRESQGKAAR